MKELSIEEKAQRYDEAIKKAKDMLSYKEVRREDMEYLFPELKESEDERIRKRLLALIEWSKSYAASGITTDEAKEMLAWLEKQGENAKFYDSIQVGDKVTRNEDGVLVNLSQLKRVAKKDEKQCEQKSADKVEPKFHEGEWIVKNDNSLINIDYSHCKITKVENGNYTIESIYSYKGYNTFETFEKDYHLWTIQDANDGDVLIDKSHARECPFIFKETKPSDIKTDVLNPLTVLGYCGIGGAGFTKGSGWGDTANCTYYPATKEQRDLLFQKMKEEGYEWDAEKKELKKKEVDNLHNYLYDEQKPVDKVESSAFKDELLKLFQKFRYIKEGVITNGDIIDYVDAHIQKLVGTMQKPAWSEEDDIMAHDIDNALRSQITYPKSRLQSMSTWIGNLKNRVQSKQEWSEEDKCMLNNVIDTLKPLSQTTHSGYAINSMINWLKSLRPQNWTKEDKERYISCLQRLSTGNPEQSETINSKWFKEHVYPQSQWKPSKEQIKALSYYLKNDIDNDGVFGCQLVKLYQDLKKLREE